MKKTELIAKVAAAAGTDEKTAGKIINAFTDTVASELAKGEKVQLIGFGTFEVLDRPERTGRNPFNNEEITIAASKSPRFKAGKSLKDKVNG